MATKPPTRKKMRLERLKWLHPSLEIHPARGPLQDGWPPGHPAHWHPNVHMIFGQWLMGKSNEPLDLGLFINSMFDYNPIQAHVWWWHIPGGSFPGLFRDGELENPHPTRFRGRWEDLFGPNIHNHHNNQIKSNHHNHHNHPIIFLLISRGSQIKSS